MCTFNIHNANKTLIIDKFVVKLQHTYLFNIVDNKLVKIKLEVCGFSHNFV